ncbi:MAG: hypothetical protein JWO91_2194 [Acidobacteriaceae bacterium]|jgi:hypothetical protein|nr:hypothetical protein [Acidobacteriaceae bacterium]
MVKKPVLLIATGVLMAAVPSVIAQTQSSAPLPNRAVRPSSKQDQEITKQLAYWSKKLKLNAEFAGGQDLLLRRTE